MRILVVGDAILDKYIFGNINRMSPEDKTIPIVDVNNEEYRLGGCLNVAANLKSLSKHNVVVFSCLSRFTGERLYVKDILHAGTFFEALHEPDKEELIKTRIINKDSNKQLVRIDNRLKYSRKSINRFSDLLERRDYQYDCIVVSDYNKGLINEKTIAAISKFPGPVFVDTKKPDLSMWNEIQNCIIKVNDEEWDSCNQRSRHRVVVTMGSRGAEIRNTQDWHDTVQFPVEDVKNAEVTGAGDTFIAALTIKFLEKNNLSEAVEFANMVAAKSVKIHGTNEVTLNEK